MTDTGNYQPLGTEPPPPAQPSGFEPTPVEPSPSSADDGVLTPENTDPYADAPVAPAASSISAEPQYLGPDVHPSQEEAPVLAWGETIEARALGLLQTIRSNGMNQILSNEIDKLLHHSTLGEGGPAPAPAEGVAPVPTPVTETPPPVVP